MTAFVTILAILFYFIPTIVVLARRNAPSGGSVVVVNVFLGWTVVGWVVALAMAVRSPVPEPPSYVVPPGFQPPQAYIMPPGLEPINDPRVRRALGDDMPPGYH
jgi:hypothetical protein